MNNDSNWGKLVHHHMSFDASRPRRGAKTICPLSDKHIMRHRQVMEPIFLHPQGIVRRECPRSCRNSGKFFQALGELGF
jgi:hypothetical protein